MHRSLRPLITVLGAVCLASPFFLKPERSLSSLPANDPRPRRLDLAVDDSDPLVSAALSVVGYDKSSLSASDHEKITAILHEARRLMGQAKDHLVKEEDEKAKEVVDAATAKFREAKQHIQERVVRAVDNVKDGIDNSHGKHRGKHRGKHQLRTATVDSDTESEQAVEEDVTRKTSLEENVDVDADAAADLDLDLSRSVYETYVTFPECVEQLFQKCLDIVNRDLSKLGLSTVEMVVHEKRNPDQAGYNKVVIVTNMDADTVAGRKGDGTVSYPYTWKDSKLGERTLGVDGKWNCQGMTPTDCCEHVKTGVENPDTKGNYLECHIFVPFGGVGNPRRDDRVMINLSPDGRVHEAPAIQ